MQSNRMCVDKHAYTGRLPVRLVLSRSSKAGLPIPEAISAGCLAGASELCMASAPVSIVTGRAYGRGGGEGGGRDRGDASDPVEPCQKDSPSALARSVTRLCFLRMTHRAVIAFCEWPISRTKDPSRGGTRRE